MADPVADIEARLRTGPTKRTATDVRRQLNELFQRLGPADSARLLERLLRADKSDVPRWFLVLDRVVRLELLLWLVSNLRDRDRHDFNDKLNGRSPDPALTKGLRFVFPEGTEAQRRQFGKALAGNKPNAEPSVRLLFRNEGDFSRDNRCAVITEPQIPIPEKLGVFEANQAVWMEIQGTVRGHRADATYRFGRTVETLTFGLIGDNQKNERWVEVDRAAIHEDKEGPGKVEGGDEDRNPDHGYIYVVDGPSLHTPPPKAPDSTKECVKFLNFVEVVEVLLWNKWHYRHRVDSVLPWCACLWIKKAAGGWALIKAKSGNRAGEIPIREMKAALDLGSPVDPNGMF